MSDEEYEMSDDKPLDKNMKIRDIQMIEERPHYPHLGAFVIRWSSERGFGEYTIFIEADGTIAVDTECDGKSRVKQALGILIDNAKKVD